MVQSVSRVMHEKECSSMTRTYWDDVWCHFAIAGLVMIPVLVILTCVGWIDDDARMSIVHGIIACLFGTFFMRYLFKKPIDSED